MFQSFDVTSTPQFGRERVTGLRAAFGDLGIDGFLVPRADEYQGEYVPKCSERLAWLTGFTGSAGVALVTQSQAVVFVDGRYVTQLAEQVDKSVFTGGDLVDEPPHVWLPRHAPKGFRLGIDPWLHTGAEVRRLEKALAEIGGKLIFLTRNPLDKLWSDRPAEPLGAVIIQDIAQAGVLARDKLATIAADLKAKNLKAALITDPSSVAWIFNIRGNDVPHTPHPLARAIIHAEGEAQLFLDKRKTKVEAEAYLAQICKQLPPSDLAKQLGAVSANGGRIFVDPDLASYALTDIIRRRGRRGGGRHRSSPAAARAQECRRNQRVGRSSSAGRCRYGRIPLLAGHQQAGHGHGNCRRRATGGNPGTRRSEHAEPAEGYLLRHHRRCR